MQPKKLKIMVSSTVYGVEELLERIYTLLTAFGYEVWMSHKGTLPVSSTMSALDNCLQGVERCDLFLGIITPYYGSSGKADRSFTHQEMCRAIERKKPRWFLAHDHVVFARQLLRDLGYKNHEKRLVLLLADKAASINDMRVIDMYEDAIHHQIKLMDRQGNWVQKYQADDDAQLFAVAQFSRYAEVEQFVTENFGNHIEKRLTSVIEEGNA